MRFQKSQVDDGGKRPSYSDRDIMNAKTLSLETQAHPLVVVDPVRTPDNLHVVVGRCRCVDRDDNVAGILGVEGPVNTMPS